MDGHRAAEREANVKPPEYWTEANTVRWQRGVWGGEAEASEAQRGWGSKLNGYVSPPRNRAALTRPLTAKEYAASRGEGPANPVFFDGTPQPYIRAVKGKRTRRNAA
jgi:hypothetical protein